MSFPCPVHPDQNCPGCRPMNAQGCIYADEVRLHGALTVARWLLPSPYDSCGCDPRAHHAEECLTTPLYAALVEEIDSPWGLLFDVTQAWLFSSEQFAMWWKQLGDKHNED